jgi:uncharacterized protein
MTRAAIAVLVLLALFVAFAQFVRRTGMFYPNRYPGGLWDVKAWEVVPTEHTFQSEDGTKLHAWWFRADDPAAPVLIWFHGNAGNLTDRAPMATELAKRGLSVFVFDYRGFGRSEGTASEGRLFDDALAAHDYVRDHATVPIALYGESIGGPYAAYVARERSVQAVVLENTFPSLLELGNALYHPFPLGWTAPFAMRTTDWLNEAGAPVLVMHGTSDDVIPYALGKGLYDGLRVPRELLTFRGGHAQIANVDAERYYATVTSFVSSAVSSRRVN